MQHRQARPWLQPDILFKLSGYQKEHDACLKLLHDFSYETIRNRRKEYQESKKNKGQEVTEDEAMGNRSVVTEICNCIFYALIKYLRRISS